MMELQLVECLLDQKALAHFARGQGLLKGVRGPDWKYIVHAWLGAAFGQNAPKPWRLFADQRRPLRILGYDAISSSELMEILREFANPLASRVLIQGKVATKPMPRFREGARLGFEVLVCPVGRKTDSGVEKDLYLMAMDSEDRKGVSRETLYAYWVKERMEAAGAVEVEKMTMKGLQLSWNLRKRQPKGGSHRKAVWIRRPEALMTGTLLIRDSDAFHKLLAKGIGRHRAFGFGMICLKPPGF